MARKRNNGPTIYDLAEKIKNLDVPNPEDMTSWAPLVIEVFRGSDLFTKFDVTHEMDEYSGRRFWMVRSVRNHPTWGPKLYAVLR